MFPSCMFHYSSLHHQLIGRDKMSDEADIANENIELRMLAAILRTSIAVGNTAMLSFRTK
jgi:hypothetical protein